MGGNCAGPSSTSYCSLLDLAVLKRDETTYPYTNYPYLYMVNTAKRWQMSSRDAEGIADYPTASDGAL